MGLEPAPSIAIDRRGNVIVAASAFDGTNGVFRLFKYAAADGALLWHKRQIGPGDGLISAVALDGFDNSFSPERSAKEQIVSFTLPNMRRQTAWRSGKRSFGADQLLWWQPRGKRD